jgi:hypothetical protein
MLQLRPPFECCDTTAAGSADGRTRRRGSASIDRPAVQPALI